MSTPNANPASLANRVVVGTDGSQPAREAVLWAAQWADSLGLPLTVLAGLITRYATASDATSKSTATTSPRPRSTPSRRKAR